MNYIFSISISCALLGLASCALPPVNLSTPEPVKVDINVRLDVYQHGENTKAPANESATEDDNLAASAEMDRRNRMGDIQLFKNSRIIGENHLGLLEVRNPPPGEYGKYVADVVKEENEDRMILMQKDAEEEGVSIDIIQKQRAEDWRDGSFNGEWIEVPVENGKYTWIQKG